MLAPFAYTMGPNLLGRPHPQAQRHTPSDNHRAMATCAVVAGLVTTGFLHHAADASSGHVFLGGQTALHQGLYAAAFAHTSPGFKGNAKRIYRCIAVAGAATALTAATATAYFGGNQGQKLILGSLPVACIGAWMVVLARLTHQPQHNLAKNRVPLSAIACLVTMEAALTDHLLHAVRRAPPQILPFSDLAAEPWERQVAAAAIVTLGIMCGIRGQVTGNQNAHSAAAMACLCLAGARALLVA
jgi:hypothetical protein